MHLTKESLIYGVIIKYGKDPKSKSGEDTTDRLSVATCPL